MSLGAGVEERYSYYRARYPRRSRRRAVLYALNWAKGVYRWAFGEMPPKEWIEKVEERLALIETSSGRRGRVIEEYFQTE